MRLRKDVWDKTIVTAGNVCPSCLVMGLYCHNERSAAAEYELLCCNCGFTYIEMWKRPSCIVYAVRNAGWGNL